MDRVRVMRSIAPAVVVAFLAGACTFGGSSTSHASVPVLTPVACPGDVAASILADVSCGILAVPVHHDDPSGGTDQIFVTRIRPAGGHQLGDPILTFGGDLGVSIDYGGFGQQVAELHREIDIMDVRGTGHSQPNLVCPEIDALAVDPASLPVDSDRTRSAFVAAVTACRDRLIGQGVDLGANDLNEMASDADDLRIALGVDRWNLLTIGTTSLVALAYMQAYPDQVRAAVLDSPGWPGADPVVEASSSTDDAIAAMGALCASEPSCRHEVPSFVGDVRAVEGRLKERPFTARFGDVSVTLDPGWFVLWLRSQLGFVRPPGTYLPGAIHAMANGDPRALRIEAFRLVARGNMVDQQLCEMLFPNCWNDVVRSWGVNLSVWCAERQQAARGSDGGGTNPAEEQAFDGALVDEACRAWGAGTAAARPVRSSVPTLIILGRFDPYGSAALAKQAIVGFDHASIVISPDNGHQVTGVSRTGAEQDAGVCVIRLRDAWLDNPAAPPDTSCLGRMPFDLSLPLDWQRP